MKLKDNQRNVNIDWNSDDNDIITTFFGVW